MEGGLSFVHSWVPGSEMEPWTLYNFKSSMWLGSWPCQAEELGNQFIGLRTGAGLLCLQMHTFYGIGDVV